MWVLITVILSSAITVVTGYTRFWGTGQPGIWVDLLFLASMAITVAAFVAFVMKRMRRLGGMHTTDIDTRDHS